MPSPQVEKLMHLNGWNADEFTTLFNEVFLNAVCHPTLHPKPQPSPVRVEILQWDQHDLPT